MIFAYSLPGILLLTLFTSSNYFSFEMHLSKFKYLRFKKDASQYLSKIGWLLIYSVDKIRYLLVTNELLTIYNVSLNIFKGFYRFSQSHSIIVFAKGYIDRLMSNEIEVEVQHVLQDHV